MEQFATEWDSPPNSRYDLWTVTNASEIVPGVLTPLLASWTAAAEERTMRRVVEDYGGTGKIRISKTPVPNFAGIFGGRLALNMGLTAAIYSLVDPDIGEAVLQQFFTGVTGTQRFIVRSTDAERAATVAHLEALREAAQGRLDADRARLYEERATDRFRQDTGLGLGAAWDRQEELTVDAIELFLTHMHVTLAAGEYQVKLGGVLQAAGQAPELVVPLCSGLGEVESSKPAVGIYQLATKARARPAVAEAIRHDEPKSVLARLDSPPDAGWRQMSAAFRSFLFDFGYRVQGEYDPSTPDWSEEPTFALSQIRAMLDVAEADSPVALLKRAKAQRVALERQVRTAVDRQWRPAFDAMLADAQRFTRMREYSKAMWILGQRRGRATYLALSRGLAGAGVLTQPDDARFLTFGEIGALCRGRRLPDAGERVARRRTQYLAAERMVLPDTWTGMPQIKPKPRRGRGRRLTGLGVSAGVATGRARIIADVSATADRDIEPGEVLVAPFTDAPWTPLFIPAGAVVVETGGVLSHAATVAREFGIPCVVMVKGATQTIRDGDLVTVDGTAGTVTIAPPERAAPAP